jgi:hypothetical protein
VELVTVGVIVRLNEIPTLDFFEGEVEEVGELETKVRSHIAFPFTNTSGERT